MTASASPAQTAAAGHRSKCGAVAAYSPPPFESSGRAKPWSGPSAISACLVTMPASPRAQHSGLASPARPVEQIVERQTEMAERRFATVTAEAHDNRLDPASDRSERRNQQRLAA